MATLQFFRDIRDVINRHSIDNNLNIPDDILAEFIVNLIECLDEMCRAVECRRNS